MAKKNTQAHEIPFCMCFFKGEGEGWWVGEWVGKDQITLSRRRPLGSLAYGSNSDGSWWPLVELGDWTASYHLSLWLCKLKITHSRRQHDDKHDNTMAWTLAAIPVGFASICHFSYGRIPPTQKRVLLELSFFRLFGNFCCCLKILFHLVDWYYHYTPV